MTLPRRTAVRVSWIVPLSTPVWMGFGPLYRNWLAPYTVVATLKSSGGATAAGSGGRLRVGVAVGVLVDVGVGVSVGSGVGVGVEVGVGVSVGVGVEVGVGVSVGV